MKKLSRDSIFWVFVLVLSGPMLMGQSIVLAGYTIDAITTGVVADRPIEVDSQGNAYLPIATGAGACSVARVSPQGLITPSFVTIPGTLWTLVRHPLDGHVHALHALSVGPGMTLLQVSRIGFSGTIYMSYLYSYASGTLTPNSLQ